MQPDEIKALIEAGIAGTTVEQISSDEDGKHTVAVIVSSSFEGLLPVKRQQLVYAALDDAISSGAIHALQMKTLTPAQWAAQNA